MGLLDFINPWSWRADRRGERELRMAEERDAAQRRAKLGARYAADPPTRRRSRVSSAATGTTSLLPWSPIEHHLIVNWEGPSTADEVHLWLAYGDADQPVRRTEEKRLGLLGASSPERQLKLVENDFAGGCVPRDGWLMCRWTDGEGEHVEPLLELTAHI